MLEQKYTWYFSDRKFNYFGMTSNYDRVLYIWLVSYYELNVKHVMKRQTFSYQTIKQFHEIIVKR